MRHRWTPLALALLLALVGLLPPAATSAQGCSPRPKIELIVGQYGPGRLLVGVLASTPIKLVHFPGATANVPGPPNYAIEVDGVRRSLPYTLIPSFAGATEVAFYVHHTGGGALTVPLVVEDACGPWPTFVGAGPAALAPPPVSSVTWTPGVLALSAAPGTIASGVVHLTSTTELRGMGLALSPELQSSTLLFAAIPPVLPSSTRLPVVVEVSVPAGASPGTVRGSVAVRIGFGSLEQALPVEITIVPPTTAAIPEGLVEPTADRIAVPGDGPAYVADQVLIGVAPGTSALRVDEIAASVGAVVVGKQSELRWYQLRLGGGAPGLDQAISQLLAIPGVTMASRSVLLKRLARPNDREFSSWDETTPADNNWGHELVRLPDAWNLTTGFRDITVAVVEDGFDLAHEDLAGNLAPGGTACSGCTVEDWAHGSTVAGIVGARGNNGIGYAGVAWDTVLLLRGRKRVTLTNAGLTERGIQEGYAEAAFQAVKDGAAIVNISIGITLPDAQQARALDGPWRDMMAKVKQELNKDVLFVLGAANDRAPVDRAVPARLSLELANVTTVGGVRRCDNRGECAAPVRDVHANAGDGVAVAAPSTDIAGLFYDCNPLSPFACPSAYIDPTGAGSTISWEGTSFAAPFVTGVAVLLQARAKALGKPPRTAEQLRELVVAGAIAGNKWVCRYFVPVAGDCTSQKGIPVLNAEWSLKALEGIKRYGVGTVGPGGTTGHESSGAPALSGDGRYLAFETKAQNLVPGTLGRPDIGSSVLVKDRQTGEVEWASDPARGGPPAGSAAGRGRTRDSGRPASGQTTWAIAPSISADGQYVAFAEYTVPDSGGPVTTNIVVYNRQTRSHQVFSLGTDRVGTGLLTSLLHEFPQLVISGDGSTLVYTKNVTPGIPRGDLIAIDRVSGARGSIASGSVLVPRPEGCPDPGPNGCLTPVPLREAGPVMVGRGISNDGQTVLVHACCDHLYAVRGGGATQLDPPLPSNEKSGVFFMDISADGGTVLFTHGGTPVPAIPGYRPPVRMYARSLGGGGATLEENLSDADVFWDGPVALSGDGRLAFYQVTKRSGAPLSDHPTLARPMIVRDTTTGQLVRDPTTGTAEIVTATTDGVTLRCGLTGYRLATSLDGSVLAYTTEDFEDTLDVIPWDRNLYFDAHVIDRSIPIRAPITSAPCPFLPTSGSTR